MDPSSFGSQQFSAMVGFSSYSIYMHFWCHLCRQKFWLPGIVQHKSVGVSSTCGLWHFSLSCLSKYSYACFRVKVGVSVGALFSLLAILYLAMVYVPSAVATVISFRSGVIGSLKDRQFPVHRYALDQTTILYGAAFWGALFTCALLWALTGSIAFIVVWKVRNLKANVETKCMWNFSHYLCGVFKGGSKFCPNRTCHNYWISYYPTPETTDPSNTSKVMVRGFLSTKTGRS